MKPGRILQMCRGAHSLFYSPVSETRALHRISSSHRYGNILHRIVIMMLLQTDRTMTVPHAEGAQNSQMSSEKDEMSADAGIRTRVLTLARLSDNQLHYVHTGKAWIHSLNINITDDGALMKS